MFYYLLNTTFVETAWFLFNESCKTDLTSIELLFCHSNDLLENKTDENGKGQGQKDVAGARRFSVFNILKFYNV